MISCWIATSLRRDDGYVELAQVAQDQDLGASVVIKEKDIVLKVTCPLDFSNRE